MAICGVERDSDWYKLAQGATAKLIADNVNEADLKAVKRCLSKCSGGVNVFKAWLRYQEPARIEYQVFGNGYLVCLTGHKKQIEITTSEPRKVAAELAQKYGICRNIMPVEPLEIREVRAFGR